MPVSFFTSRLFRIGTLVENRKSIISLIFRLSRTGPIFAARTTETWNFVRKVENFYFIEWKLLNHVINWVQGYKFAENTSDFARLFTGGGWNLNHSFAFGSFFSPCVFSCFFQMNNIYFPFGQSFQFDLLKNCVHELAWGKRGAFQFELVYLRKEQIKTFMSARLIFLYFLYTARCAWASAENRKMHYSCNIMILL